MLLDHLEVNLGVPKYISTYWYPPLFAFSNLKLGLEYKVLSNSLSLKLAPISTYWHPPFFAFSDSELWLEYKCSQTYNSIAMSNLLRVLFTHYIPKVFFITSNENAHHYIKLVALKTRKGRRISRHKLV